MCRFRIISVPLLATRVANKRIPLYTFNTINSIELFEVVACFRLVNVYVFFRTQTGQCSPIATLYYQSARYFTDYISEMSVFTCLPVQSVNSLTRESLERRACAFSRQEMETAGERGLGVVERSTICLRICCTACERSPLSSATDSALIEMGW